MRNHRRRFQEQNRQDVSPAKPGSGFWPAGYFTLSAAGLLLTGALLSRSLAAGPPPVASPELLSQTLSALAQGPQPARVWTNYVGDAACLPCHQAKVDAYHRTAHYLTSSWPTRDSIHGNFSEGANLLLTRSTNLVFKMEADKNGFTQTAVLRVSPSEVKTHGERFGVVIGSGRKGQTYLYWHHDRLYDCDELFELPVSYWVERGTWMNSPGLLEYPDGTANFTRPITPRCLECHTTAFDWLDTAGNRFNKYGKTNLVLGITCEKCHGPGRDHVAHYQSPSPPPAVGAAAMINPAKLSRDRQMDVCALCHAGFGTMLVPSLSYKPGDVLSNDLALTMPGPDTPVDVHGNQVQLLARSHCFKASPNLTCVTCHDVHQPQRDIQAMASSRLACHQITSCGLFPKLGHVIDKQCVFCHMPLQPTGKVEAISNGQVFQPKVRNHQIAIYPDVRLP